MEKTTKKAAAAQDKTPYVKAGEGFVEVTLNTPLDIGGTKVTVIRMREPTVNDQLIMDEREGTEVQLELALISDLCKLTEENLRKLSMRDYKRLQVGFHTFTD